jgi:hypothetical protein
MSILEKFIAGAASGGAEALLLKWKSDILAERDATLARYQKEEQERGQTFTGAENEKSRALTKEEGAADRTLTGAENEKSRALTKEEGAAFITRLRRTLMATSSSVPTRRSAMATPPR